MKLKAKNYFIKTFGCQMNESDSERIAGFLELQKFKLVKNINEADLVIFNTCGIRKSAEDRAFGLIHNLKAKSYKLKAIILTGCLANQKDVQRKLKNKVDLFCEIKDFQKEIKNLLSCHPERSFDNNQNAVEGSTKKYNQKYHKADSSATPQNDTSYLNIFPKHTNTHQAFVPIMTGCNNFCSYCVVPYARGREISRSPKEILAEIKNLIKNDCKEIVLLGQNVNSYNFEFRISNFESNPNDIILKNLKLSHSKLNQNSKLKIKNSANINFPKLLRLIEKIPGNFRISFMSSHPKDYSSELIETIAKSKKICEHIHLPLQAGSDEILAKMNRKYTAKKYLELVKKIKSAFAKYKPNKLYSITTDIIVGFPGETKKQFLQSARIMQKVGFDMVYFGQFSPRPGTVAYTMKDNVSKLEKKRREKFLNEILKKTIFANNKKFVGKIEEVLIDKEKNGFYFGRTRTMKNVRILYKKKNLIGKIVKVKITKANNWNLEACLPMRQN